MRALHCSTYFLALSSYLAATLGLLLSSTINAMATTETTAATTAKHWELGLGLGAVGGPDYRGSDEYRSFVSPIPYFIYRGKYIRSDREGVRGNFLRTDQYEFTLSASASITPETEKNTLREGMPELGSTLELGPSFNINLTGDDFSRGWHLQLPWRAVFAIGADNNGYLGTIVQPQLVYRTKISHWTFHYRAGITFASNDYHDYYYRVAPDYATENRPAFNAGSGYSGWNNNFAFSRNLSLQGVDTRLALFIRYDNIEHSDITNSPLVVDNHSLRGGIAFIWVIK
uniref:MipA/OmpV family protein n=1 Tax=Cellvibrio fontiphilus TaxID=1815559 RepID=UPI002B4BD985|nr:MipA/OmpV family protein [Cellvibrio fontiphilus]